MNKLVNVITKDVTNVFGQIKRKDAIVSSCEFADSCPAFQSGRCAIDFQKCENLKEYIFSRERKMFSKDNSSYNDFVEEWGNIERTFSTIRLRPFEKIANGRVRMSLLHIDINKALKGESGYSAYLKDFDYYVNEEELTAKDIRNIMESYSLNSSGNKVYNEHEKNSMLESIKELCPELYSEYLLLKKGFLKNRVFATL